MRLSEAEAFAQYHTPGMSLVLSLLDPGLRPDCPPSQTPFTPLDKPHSLGRKDLEKKYRGILGVPRVIKKFFLPSEYL